MEGGDDVVSSVDNRVVRMTFDNAKFEKRIRETKKSLEEFEKALKLDGATAGLDVLKKSTDKLDITALGKKAEKEAQRVQQSSETSANSFKAINKAADNVDVSAIGKGAEKEASKVSNAASDVVESINRIDDNVDNLSFSALGTSVAAESEKISKSASEAIQSIDSIDSAADDADFSALSKASMEAVDDVNQNVNTLDLTPIVDETSEAAQGFSVMEEIAIGALREIGTVGVDFVLGKLKDFGRGVKEWMIDPIKDGFKEYETQMGAIQTIIANTGMSFDSDTDIQKVNEALDELNTYADDTIYNFTEMTKAIGTFTSSGLGLEDAKNAVQGAANVAAVAGAETSALNRVLPQLAQALSAGTVSQQDWMSVQTAQMDSLLFRKTIGDVAMHMAEAGRAEESAFIAGQELLEGANMRQLLNKKDRKDIADWFSSDILAESLQMFTYDLDKMQADERAKIMEHLRELGYETDEEIQAIQQRAEMARRAATEVRTFSQLTDTLKEAIGSNWSGVWRNFIGDFKQATDTFTFLSNTMSAGVDGLLGGIVHSMQIFNRFEDKNGVFGEKGGIYSLADILWGGYDRYTEEDFTKGLIADEALIGSKKVDQNGELVRIKGALDYIVEAITTPLNAIGDAFNSVFGMADEQIFETMGSFILAFKDFAQGLIMSDDAAQGLYNISKGLFSILDIGIRVVLDIVTALFGALDVMRAITDPLLDIAFAIGGQLGKAIEWVHDKILDIREAVVEALQPMFGVVSIITDIVRSFFGFADIPYTIDGVGDVLIGLLDILWQFIDIPGKIRALGDVLSTIFGFIGDLTGWNSAAAEANAIFAETGERANIANIWFEHLSKNPIIGFFSNLVGKIREAFDMFVKFVSNVQLGNKETEDANNKIGGLTSAFGLLKNILDTVSSVLGGIGKVLLTIIGIGIELGKVVGNIVGQLASSVLSWEPIAKINSKLEEFKNGSINFFLSLPDKIRKLSADVSKGVSTFGNRISDNLDKFASTLKNLRSINISDVFDNIKDSYSSLNKTFSNGNAGNSIQGFGKNFVNSVYNPAVAASIRKIAELQNLLPFNTNLAARIEDNIAVPIRSALLGIVQLFTDAAEKSKSIPEFIVNIFSSIGKGITDKLHEAYSAIKEFDIADIGSMFNRALDGVTDRLAALKSIDVSKVFNGLKELVSRIQDVDFPAIDWKEILTKTIPNAINYAIDNIAEFIASVKTKIAEISPYITTGVSKIGGILKDKFSSVRETVGDIVKHIGDSFGSMASSAESGDKRLTTVFGNAPGTIQKADAAIGPALGNVGDKFTEFFRHVFFKDDGTVKGIGDFFLDFVIFLKDKVGAFINFVRDTPDKAKEAFDKFRAFFTIENLKPIVEFIKGLAAIKALISGSKMFSAIGEFAAAGGRTLAIIGKSLKAKQKDDTMEHIVEILKSFAILIGTIAASIWLLSTVPEPGRAIDTMWGMGGLIAAMSVVAGLLQKFAKGSGDNMIKIAGTIGVFGISMLIAMKTITKLTGFDWKGNIPGLLAMGGALAILGAIAAAISRWGGDGGKEIIKIAIGLGILCVSIQTLIDPISRLTEYIKGLDEAGIASLVGSLAVVGVLVGELGAILAIAGNSEHAIAVGIGFTIMAAGINVLVNAISLLTATDNDILKMSAAFVGLTVLLYEFNKIITQAANGGAIKASIALLAFSAAISMMANALSVLAGSGTAEATAAGASIAVLLGELIYMTKKLKAGDLVSTSGALLIFSASVAAIAASLYVFSTNDPAPLLATAGAVGGLLAVFALLAKFTNGIDLVATAGAIVGFSASIAIMAGSLYALQSVNLDSLKTAGIVLGGLVGAFALLATFTNGIDIALTAISFGIFASAVGVLSTALEYGATAMVKLASATPVLTAFASAVTDHFLEFGAAAVGATLLSIGLTALGAALAIFGTGATIGAGSVAILSTSLDALSNLANRTKAMFDAFFDLGYNITAGIGTGIVSGIGAVLTSVGTMVGAIFSSILSFFGIHSPSTLMADEIGQYIPAGIGVGMMDNIGSIDINGMLNSVTQGIDIDGLVGNITSSMDLGSVFSNMTEGLDIPGAITTALNGIGAWFTSDGIPMLEQLLNGFWNWFVTDGLTIIQNVGSEILNKLGELAQMFWNWFTTEGLPMIGQAASNFWNWFTTEGLPMLGNFIMGIFGKLGELLTGLGNWIVKDGLPMLGTAVSTFANWAKTDGLPALGRFLLELLKSLGGLLKDIGKWIINDALPAIGKWLLDILGKLKELPGMLLEWAKGLPDKIWEGLGDIAEWAGNIGKNIIDGIVEGITKVPGAIADAVTGMASGGLDAIKRFFGINSPSRVMREDVGRYIPEGLAAGIEKYASIVTKKARQLGVDTGLGLDDGLSTLNYDRMLDANIVPVINTDSYKTAIGDLNNGLTGFLDGGTLRAQSEQLIDASLDSSNLSRTFVNQTNAMLNRIDKWQNSQMSAEAEHIGRLEQAVTNLYDKIDKMNVYLDSGALVGGIAPEMDKQLGRRQAYAARGIH